MITRPGAYAIFYPVAALHAALVLPVSVFWRGDSLAHAQEMLFGFALAVVAGNQLGTATGGRLALLAGLWLAGRAAFFLAPGGLVSITANAIFAALLAAWVAPRLFGAAKKLRNQALPAVLVGICVAGLAWPLVRYFGDPVLLRGLVLPSVCLFSLLLLFMGGRIIAPAVAGQYYRQGRVLGARVQPWLEAALIVSAGLAVVAPLVPGGEFVGAAALAAAGAVATVRLVRWRLWGLRGCPDLLCLACGYAWLSLGLLALAAAVAAGGHRSAAIHVVTVGALGTLTLNVMAMSWVLKTRTNRIMLQRTVVPGTLLMAGATVFRILGAYHPDPWLLVAALCWSAAFATLGVLFAVSACRGDGG